MAMMIEVKKGSYSTAMMIDLNKTSINDFKALVASYDSFHIVKYSR
ncbi:MAG: hypothetical protein L6U99_03060 [Clostridium sp.]|nr:MAG: hypothetical protein L6U99_03060 [Clostridium sp.]